MNDFSFFRTMPQAAQPIDLSFNFNVETHIVSRIKLLFFIGILFFYRRPTTFIMKTTIAGRKIVPRHTSHYQPTSDERNESSANIYEHQTLAWGSKSILPRFSSSTSHCFQPVQPFLINRILTKPCFVFLGCHEPLKLL